MTLRVRPHALSRSSRSGRPRIAEFLVVTFTISWGSWAFVLVHGGDQLAGINLPFFVLGSFGPLLAACFIRVIHGPAAAERRRSWRIRHLVPVLALRAAGTVAALVGGTATGQRTFDPHAAAQALTSFGNPILFSWSTSSLARSPRNQGGGATFCPGFASPRCGWGCSSGRSGPSGICRCFSSLGPTSTGRASGLLGARCSSSAQWASPWPYRSRSRK
jgi:hypothetical protein